MHEKVKITKEINAKYEKIFLEKKDGVKIEFQTI